MKRLLFYCQHILGIGHLIRSMEIVKGLTKDFQICFINGGEAVNNLPIPKGVEVIQLPPLKTDKEFSELQLPPGFDSLETVFDSRRQQMLTILERFQPDVLMIELFPFGRRRFSPELIPLIEAARDRGTKIVSSLRDIVVTKQDQARHEAKVCKLINQYFDLLLIHGDSQFMPLERSFSRIADLNCPVHYTGYVVQSESSQSFRRSKYRTVHQSPLPTILTSVGGGRFGHELLDCVAQASIYLEGLIPHHIQMFTGPFSPNTIHDYFQSFATLRPNLTVERYTPNLMAHMRQADLSINMGGYNTTLNVLKTRVRCMLLPFTGNGDQEQTIRAERLEEMGIVSVIRANDLHPQRLAQRIVNYLRTQPSSIQLDLNGVAQTAQILRDFTATPIASVMAPTSELTVPKI
ncbi:glycosyltransferase [Oscillatoria sp. CS-180]|uniref:glycosyltransferase family protein n=1 Tax=Oscillatoria sp. CS-180 TaxID=3021720 RepID=UPI00232D0E28|nr:glycosyltransferase [Oscillatoria sp. CS-180]MDB9527261.1 glycosyltransferase [Oscillatoria sp. CS-180]